MKYMIIRTEKADELIHRIILYVAEQFGNDVALEKLDELETAIRSLGENPYIGIIPRYTVLRRQGYLVLITKKDLVFYKVNEHEKTVTIYAVVDQRQEYLSIIRGL
ncbi:MAG: type II toxin-antitoxin system RelE/ParE family toxin [Clostridia bacterium]|nr:type II toxin-antitoxin system RelE/ParE family toxin [Clostridia bacterium]